MDLSSEVDRREGIRGLAGGLITVCRAEMERRPGAGGMKRRKGTGRQEA